MTFRTITPDHPLNGCRLKVERAYAQLHELDSALKAFDGRQPYSRSREFNAERQEIVIRACLTEAAPPEVALIFGDCIHNLRSSLDYAVNELIREFGHRPSRTAAFPIFTVRDGPSGYFCKSPSMLPGLPQAVTDTIEAMQPYHGANATVPASHMAALQELWNKEKHRALLLTAAAMWFDYIAHNRTNGEQSGITMRLSSTQDCAEFVVAPAEADEYLDPHFTVQVKLAEGGPLQKFELMQIVAVLDDTVRQVVAALVPFFSRPAP